MGDRSSNPGLAAYIFMPPMLRSVSPLKATSEMHFAASERVVPACLQPNAVSTVPVRHWRKGNGVFSAPLKPGDIHSSHILAYFRRLKMLVLHVVLTRMPASKRQCG